MAGIGPIRQDWEPVVVRKKAPTAAAKKDEKAVNAARRSGAEIETMKKYNAGTNKAASSGTSLNTKRLDDDTESLAHERVPSDLKKNLMQARLDKKMTQAQLAQMINEKPQVIQEYESGKAIPNQQIIGKLERALGTKLRRVIASGYLLNIYLVCLPLSVPTGTLVLMDIFGYYVGGDVIPEGASARQRDDTPPPAHPLRDPPSRGGDLPDDDDILSEILLRLPPQPSSLPRASLVCKSWHRFVADPHFRRRFRARHRSPPLIGVFEDQLGYPFFRSVMDPPNHIPSECFCPRFGDGKVGWDKGGGVYSCRHGRVLLYNRNQKEIVLWDPLSGDHRVVAVPLEFDSEEKMIWNGAVLCAAVGDPSHVHGGFSSCPFKVVLVGVINDYTQVFVCCYSSETGNWSDLVSATIPFKVYCFSDPGTLVGNAMYWLPGGLGLGILKFNLDTHGLDVIEWPSGVTVSVRGSCQIVLLAEDVSLGFAAVSDDSL
ncbi:hypothetical protein HU200_033146 [Digitaria exilis]|uniref:HTH cro/C1-type domain-containing protein n=1 Tax=Digitaria exilis TaxID=1010633 RepID=A0A835BJC4_9POAL|nr:hypothetical protein HU200_033146 [Digitaria exilis]